MVKPPGATKHYWEDLFNWGESLSGSLLTEFSFKDGSRPISSSTTTGPFDGLDEAAKAQKAFELYKA